MSLTARIAELAQAVGADIKTALAHIGSRGSAHGVATTSEAGFLSATDKTKLDSMSEGASGDANAAVATHAGAADPHGVTYPITPGGYAVDITGSDLNSLYRTGFYRGYGLAHSPLDNGGWWHVLIASGDANWVKQTATAFGSGNNAGDIYERVCNAGVWTSWASVFKQGTAIEGTPIGQTTPAAGVFTELSTTSIFAQNTPAQINYHVLQVGGVNKALFGSQVSMFGGTSPNYGHYLYDDCEYFVALAGTKRMQLTSAGLSVTGNIAATGRLSTAGIKEDASGNLGIGTSSPGAKLDVAGGAVGASTLAGRTYSTGIISSTNPNIVNGSGFNSIPIRVGDVITFYNNQVRTVTSVTDTQLTVNAAWTTSFSGVSATGSGGLGFNTNGTERLRIDTSGNLGLGVTPSAWDSGQSVFQSQAASWYGYGTNNMTLSANAYYNASWRYINSTVATRYDQTNGAHQWYIAPSGTAGQPINFTQDMALNSTGLSVAGSGTFGGNVSADRLRSETEVRAQQLVIGNLATSTGVNLISNSVFQELAIVLALGEETAQFLQSAYSSKHNPASSAVLAVGHTSAAGRSIDATGTINASGADYAEHEPNNGHKIIKGQIVGFDADGKLTTQFSEALRFAVKSTEPGYTGGNTWMSNLPPRPTQPVLRKVERRSYGEADEVNPDAEVDALIEQEYQDALVAAEIEYQSALAQYERDTAIFDKAVAEAVSKVDRIAYCGKVPVNYQGADAGQYLIAKAMPDDSIGCYAVYAPTFQEYLHCIGRVNKVLPDGRAEIAVIIH